MNTEIVRKFRWFWAWQDEKEEAWLSKMARDGLHLQTVSPFGFYSFRKAEPGNYIYRLDFQSLKAKDRNSYLQLFEDAGWEHIGDMGGWVYFRHPINGSAIPEIYSDQESKIGKYQRVLTFLVIFLPIMIVILPNARRLDSYMPALAFALAGIQAIIFLLFSYAIVRLIMRINQLKNRG